MKKSYLKKLCFTLVLCNILGFNLLNARTVYKMKAKAFKMRLLYHKGTRDFMDYKGKTYLMLHEGFKQNELIFFINTKKSDNYRLAFPIDKKGNTRFLTVLLRSQKIENHQLRGRSKKAYACNDYKVAGSVKLIDKSILVLKSLSDEKPILTFFVYKNNIPKNALMPNAKKPIVTAILEDKKNIDAFIQTAKKYCKK